MNWISRSIAPTFSSIALLALSLIPATTFAGSSVTYAFQNQSITFTHVDTSGNETMIGMGDPAFRTLLKDVGAVITWNPGEKYVLITTSEPQVVSFDVGDARYDIGPVSAEGGVAPYFRGDEVYVSLDEVLNGLSLAAKRDGEVTVLQPQLSSIDLRGEGSQATLVAHGAGALHARIVPSASDRVVYEFDGVGTTLARSRALDAGGVRSLAISTEGTARDPKTIVTVFLWPGARVDAPRSNDGSDFEVAFSGQGAAAPTVATTQPNVPEPVDVSPTNAPPSDAPIPAQSADTSELAQVTAVTAQSSNDGMTVTVTVAGNANFEWHRLREPDNRFWIDIENTQLAVPPIVQTEPDPIGSLRVHQDNPTTVRVALSLTGQNNLTVSPSGTGLVIAVSQEEVADAAREGQGSVGSIVAVSDAQPEVTPAAYGATGASDDWKFGPRSTYVPTNPKLIVIDPGHGGSDRGAAHGDTTEASVNLDMAKRLRDILVSRGWEVQMTRTTDVDVYAPNDTAHEELQARVDVANNAGARLFISIHANSFINSGPNGITVYYSKPSDEPLARMVDSNLGSNLGLKDDGTVKSHLYVTLHSLMPAVLVETAFLSNPSDYQLLISPDWRQKVAQTLADGIGRYTQAYPIAEALDSSMVGLFDSGLGGLTVVRRVRERLPHADIVFFADQAHVPYGDRTPENLRELLHINLAWLDAQEVDAIVAACNTSCAVADVYGWPTTNAAVFDLLDSAAAAVGASNARRIGVVGTAATVKTGAYGRRIRHRITGADVYEVAAPALVPLVESGDYEGEHARAQVAAVCAQLPKDIDVLVLGCTHYPVLEGHFAAILGPGVQLIDPAVMQAERASALMESLDRAGHGTTRYVTNGDLAVFHKNVAYIMADPNPATSALAVK